MSDAPKRPIVAVPYALLDRHKQLTQTRAHRTLTPIESAELLDVERRIAAAQHPQDDPVATYETAQQRERLALELQALRLRAQSLPPAARVRLPPVATAVTQYKVRIKRP